MKNREKYREEILENAVYQKREICDFKQKEMFPHFGKEDGCTGISCSWCSILTDLWLDEEYVEPKKPEVDWDNVPIDTLVRVRDFEDDAWVLRYFSKYRKDDELRYVTFYMGTTSVTAKGSVEYWKYCELVEVKDE